MIHTPPSWYIKKDFDQTNGVWSKKSEVYCCIYPVPVLFSFSFTLHMPADSPAPCSCPDPCVSPASFLFFFSLHSFSFRLCAFVLGEHTTPRGIFPVELRLKWIAPCTWFFIPRGSGGGGEEVLIQDVIEMDDENSDFWESWGNPEKEKKNRVFNGLRKSFVCLFEILDRKLICMLWSPWAKTRVHSRSLFLSCFFDI